MDISRIKNEDDIRQALEGYSQFQIDVYLETFKIPKGKVSTYGRIAKRIGRPKAYRAVATTLKNNPLYPVVPCHRVVKEDGSFGGPAERASGRRDTCLREGVPIRNGKVVMSKEVVW